MFTKQAALRLASVLFIVGGAPACISQGEGGSGQTGEQVSELAVTKSCYSPNGANPGTMCGACNGLADNGTVEFSVGDLYACTADDPNGTRGMCTLKTQCGFGCESRGLQNNNQYADTCTPSPGIFSLAATTIKGGTAVQGKATFNTPHPLHLGISAQFWTASDDVAVLDSPLVNVAPSQTTLSFTVRTKAVTKIRQVHVTGYFIGTSIGDEEQAILLTLTP
jgi:hypothetical protein